MECCKGLAPEAECACATSRIAELDQALRVLAEIHTGDDDVTGFVVWIGAHANDFRTRWTKADNVEAWRVVRQHLNMQTEPRSK